MTKKVNPRTGVSTFANHYKPNALTKVCKRASTSPAQEKLFFKISTPSKFFNTATAQPTHKAQNTNLTMTAKPLSELTFSRQTTERQLVTAVLRNGGFSASYASFVVGSSSVLRMTICAKNPPLRKAAFQDQKQVFFL
jgi:hypothetical protein